METRTSVGAQARSRRAFLLGVLAASAAAAVGCSDGPSPTTVTATQLRGGSLARDVQLTGTRFAVGSKKFTEQVVLGRMLLYALQAAGATTVDHTGLSGSGIARSALESGAIDMYWEYAGTGWTLFLKEERSIPDDRALFDAVARADARRNEISWLGPARFGNQYAIARRSDVTGPLAGVTTMSEMARYVRDDPERGTLCAAAEFMDREFDGLQTTYDVDFPLSQVYQNDIALDYVNVAKGSPCDFAEVFTTDARLRALNLTILRDDRNFFTTQLAGLTVRSRTVADHPPLRTLVDALAERLTTETMIELNGLVDLQGFSEDEAALLFLRRYGFIGT